MDHGKYMNATHRNATRIPRFATLDKRANDLANADRLGEASQVDGESLYQALIEHASDAIMIVQHGQAAYRNRAHEKWFGFSADGLAAPRLSILARAEHREWVQAYEQALYRGEEVPACCQMTLLNQDGQWLHLEVHARVITYWGALATVITMRVRQETGATTGVQHREPQGSLKSAQEVDDIVGTSPALHRVLQQVQQVAGTDTTVLITGETGTGKELIARALHHLSPRRAQPLVKVNCTALPTGLIESELFGHEKGAFTGAIARKLGRFELAEGGTLFLDEIGDLALDVQAKLLRVLQEGEFERVGGTQTLSSNVRIIAATHRDLKRSVSAETFRADLFYRLHVFPIHLPPLRERVEDIPLLVQRFVEKYAHRLAKSIDTIDDTAIARLTAYAWPGNIRELEHVIERALILAQDRTLTIDDALLCAPPMPQSEPIESIEQASAAPTLTLAELQRDHIEHILEQTGWVVEGPQGAARILGLHPNTLRGRMRRLGIKRPLHQV
ncbi:sigma-54 interaction domain-containing protein [Candidatus Entotheonella palauensis]|uniref:sigma-54 interaction domain-containing protein n=1 Tax=Candidatus Entotheonella palauensis TaxID=93172 RepID=UPI00211733F3|nr:sigma 54-interacting transcriptional regulator [Candidatus Entotheonella palauensis]